MTLLTNPAKDSAHDRARRTSVRQGKALDALDRCVAIWEGRVAAGGWDPERGRHAKDALAVERQIRSVKLNPLGDEGGFLNAVLGRCETLLNLTANQPAGLRSSLSACGTLLDVRQWLDAIMAREIGPRCIDVGSFVRAARLLTQTETHHAWPTAVAITGGGDHNEPVFSIILDGVHRIDEAGAAGLFEDGSSLGTDLQTAFSDGLRHATLADFKGVTGWRAAVFVNHLVSAVGGVIDDGFGGAPQAQERIVWLVGNVDLLAVVGALFYGPHAVSSNGRTADFLTDKAKSAAIRLAVDVSGDSQIVDVSERYPGILENQDILARLQRVELGALTGGGRARRSFGAL